MTSRVSVVVPVYNGAATLGACLTALQRQDLPRDRYEVIVVDDGSTDESARIAVGFPVQLVRQANRGAPGARNSGLQRARSEWVAFTDADCIPSRGWLRHLLAAVAGTGAAGGALGAAGRTLGFRSVTNAARYVDLTGGLDTERHLAHPVWPFAPSGNLLYRTSGLLAVGGFDERFSAYDACDLHARLRPGRGSFIFAPHALVLHVHRASWMGFFRQQVGYGRGVGQFSWLYRAQVKWSAGREALAWLRLAGIATAACRFGSDDAALVRRGTFLKQLGQRLGFVQSYWNPVERRRWSTGCSRRLEVSWQ